MNHRSRNAELDELLGAFALDAAGEDSERVANYVAAQPEAAAEVAAMREASGALAELTRTPPPAALKGRILASVAGSSARPVAAAPAAESDRRSTRPRGAHVLLLAAALILLLGLTVVVGLAVRSRGPSPVGADVLALQAITEPGTRVVHLEPTGQGSPVSGVGVVVTSEGTAYLIGDAVPAPTPGRTHQLWVVRDAQAPQPAGTFGGGEPAITIPATVPAGSTLAVTDEPAGGSAAPTTEISNSATVA